MTREEALAVLNLPAAAGPEEIESTYQRLVRRYPPEFQPEKFRQIDEAYRFLTSFAYQVEWLLKPQQEKATINKELFEFSLQPPTTLEEAMQEIKKQYRLAYLWKTSKV